VLGSTADQQSGTLMGKNQAMMIRDAGNPTKLLKASAEGTILVKTF